MRMLIEFDVDADIIDVPQSVVDNKEVLQRRFLKWLYNRQIKHKYWTTINGAEGLYYRSDAFVEWLNKKVLDNQAEKAAIVQQHVSVNNEQHLPSIFF